jgi:hypothetical protein
MEAKHTPGPWEVESTLRPDWDDDPMGEYTIEPVATVLTARYYAAEPESDELDAVHAENRANARLIAAAPTMADVLTECLHYLQQQIHDTGSAGATSLALRVDRALYEAKGTEDR